MILAAPVAAREAVADRIFVANYGDDSISVVDALLDREVKIIPAGHGPAALALHPHEPLLVVANSDGSTLTLVDASTLQTAGGPIGVEYSPVAVAFDRDGARLYSAHYHAKTLNVIDVATRRARGEPVALPGTPKRLRLSPDGQRLFVLVDDRAGATVVAVDLTTHTVEKTIPVDPSPKDLVVTPDRQRLLVVSFGTDTVTAIDLSSLEPVETMQVESGDGLLLHPARPLLYSMVTFDDEVVVFDYAARRRVAAIPVGPGPTYSTISPDGRFVYAVCSEAAQVVKIDTETNQTLLRIAVGFQPADALYFQDRSVVGTGGLTAPVWTWLLVAGLILGVGSGVAWVRARRRTAQEARSGFYLICV